MAAALVTALVVLAGCGAAVPGPTPDETTVELPEGTTGTETPTPTRTTVCRDPTPVPNPEEITHQIGIVNQFDEPRAVTVQLSGEGRSESWSKTFETTWVPFTITEPGSYTLRATVNGTERLNTTVDPPYGEYPTIADSVTSVVLERDGSVSLNTSWEAVAPTPVCAR